MPRADKSAPSGAAVDILLSPRADNQAVVQAYVDAVLSGAKVAGEDQILACKRYMADLANVKDYDFRREPADQIIEIIETQFLHSEGESLDGRSLKNTPFLLEPWEKFIVYNLMGFFHTGTQKRRYTEAFIFIPRKNGKALALDTPIPTPTGWSMMGDVRIGDYVLGGNGQPVKVSYVSPVFAEHECYEVVFEDGERIVADADHIWRVTTKDRRRLAKRHHIREPRADYDENGYFNIDTKALAASRIFRDRSDGKGREYFFRVPMQAALDLPEAELPIDPYILGVWIGDGDSCGSSVTTSYDDADELMRQIRARGYSCHFRESKNRAPAVTIGDGIRGQSSAPSFKADLRRLGVLNNKHIPAAYLRASKHQRMELLRGLMDTDGSCCRGQCTFCQKKGAIIDSFRELLCSLGYKNTVRYKTIHCNGKECNAHEVTFFADQQNPCFSFTRKIARLKPTLSPRMAAKTIIAVNKVNSVPTQCIAVASPAHLYLAGKTMTVTHNTQFVAALTWAMALYYAPSGSNVYIIGSALRQAMQSFSRIVYNVRRMDEDSMARIIDNNAQHSIGLKFLDEAGNEAGSIYIEALAANPDRHDSLISNLQICDELHAYKNAKQYNVIKEAGKAYTNKLCFGITTAGDDMTSFCYQRLKYCQKVLRGLCADEAYFIFVCKADEDAETGEVDYTNPIQHQKANPNYGVTIRPEDIANDAMQALNDPQQRKDFLAKSLNVYTSSMRSYFNLAEFTASDAKYDWTLEQLAKLPIKWYGGADLSKLHDLTAAALYGQYDGVDIIIPHAWFPITAAYRKADEDNIPLFGWKDDGWLDMSNSPTVNHAEVINWFVKMRKTGFKIAQVGHDRKFCREYFIGMKKAGFQVVDQPQYFYKKSEGFRHIEVAAKNGSLYYMHSPAYEYCVQNVRAIEKTDDMVQYEKVEEKQRIDIFDASVFACIRMLECLQKSQSAKEWLSDE